MDSKRIKFILCPPLSILQVMTWHHDRNIFDTSAGSESDGDGRLELDEVK